MNPVKALLLAGICLLGVSGCGVKFYYGQLDWLIPWYVEDYISLERDQRTLLEQRLLDQLAWHCSTQLPEYARWLRQLSGDAQDGLDLDEVRRHHATVEAFWRSLMEQLSPDVSHIMLSATDEQLEELFDNLERLNEENHAEFVEPAEEDQAKRRARRLQRQFKRWVGPLQPEQKQAIAEWSAALTPLNVEWLQSQRTWQAELRVVLTHRQDTPEYHAAIEALFVDPQALWPQSYRDKIDHNLDLTLAFLSEFSQGLTPQQHRRLQQRLAALADDFEQLACRAERSEAAHTS